MKLKEIKKLISYHCAECDHSCKYKGEEDDEQLLETLTECFEEIDSQFLDKHRWWDTYRKVIKIDDKYIGYITADTTGDESAWEKGFEFDPDQLCEMEATEKTITVFTVKKDK